MKFKNAAGQNMPSMHRLPAGTYYWCQCGETKNVPFCDGSHEGTGTHAPNCDGKHQEYY